MRSASNACAGVKVVSCVDMSRIRPFLKSDKQAQCIDESRENQADHQHSEGVTDGLRETESAKDQKADKEGPHTHPAIMAIEATAPPTLDTLSAIPAVPPKIAWVMLGMKSILMMKAMKTIVQGMRLASHISIE